jgi:hypothetical protein
MQVFPKALSAKKPIYRGGDFAMEWLVWIGAGLTAAGLAMIGYCIFSALRVRKAGLPDDQMRARLQRIVFLNMAALMLSALGLMSVIFGVMLA